MNTNKLFIPKFPLPQGFSSADKYLKALTLLSIQQEPCRMLCAYSFPNGISQGAYPHRVHYG